MQPSSVDGRWARSVLAAGVALAVGGCSGDQPAPADPPAATSGSIRAQEPPAVQGPSDQDEERPAAAPAPTWDEAARAGALAAATTAVTAFARPRADPQTWWADLAPLLTPAAAAAYAGTDPRNVPARSVTGDAVLVDDASAYLVGVQVPTDVGACTVLLSREGQGSPWLVEQLVPPESVSRP